MTTGIRQFALSILFGALALFVGFLLFFGLLSLREKPASHAVLPRIYNAGTVQLQRQEVIEEVTVQGTVRPLQESRVAAKVGEQVLWRKPNLRAGSRVEQGEELIRLDRRILEQELRRREGLLERAQAELERAVANKDTLQHQIEVRRRELQIAESDFRRAQRLQGEAVYSEREEEVREMALQNAQAALLETQRQLRVAEAETKTTAAAVKVSEAELKQARINLENATIEAPYTGWVGAVHVDVGDMVNVGQAVVDLVKLEEVEVPVQLPASAAEHVGLGAPVELRQASEPGSVWKGEIARLAPRLDPQNRTREAYILVENDFSDDRPDLLPGMFVTGHVEGRRFQNVFAVPREHFIDGQIFGLVPTTLLDAYVEQTLSRQPPGSDLTEERVLEDLGDQAESMRSREIYRAEALRPPIRTYANGMAIIDQGLEEGIRVVASNLDVMYAGALVDPAASE